MIVRDYSYISDIKGHIELSAQQPNAEKCWLVFVLSGGPVMIYRSSSKTSILSVLGNLGLASPRLCGHCGQRFLSKNTEGKYVSYCAAWLCFSPSSPCFCLVPRGRAVNIKQTDWCTLHNPPDAARSALKSLNNFFGFHLTTICTHDSWRCTVESFYLNIKHRKWLWLVTDASCRFRRDSLWFSPEEIVVHFKVKALCRLRFSL